MENKVLFRELKDSDIPALEDVVRKTWDYDKFATPKAAKRLAEASIHPPAFPIKPIHELQKSMGFPQV